MNFERHAQRVILKLVHALQKDLLLVAAGKGVEPVHRMRVNCRRLHNALEIFEGILPLGVLSYDPEIRKVLKKLGRARDLDVQTVYLKKLRQSLPAGDSSRIDEYLAFLNQSRQQAQPELAKVMLRLRQRKIFLKIERGLLVAGRTSLSEKFSAKEIREQIDARLQDVLQYKRFVTHSQRIKELHQLRIAAKHLRYTLESVSPLYGRKLDPLIQEILSLHQLLGKLHDIYVWKEQLEAFARGQTDPSAWTPLIQSFQKNYQETHHHFVLAWQKAVAQQLWPRLKSFSF